MGGMGLILIVWLFGWWGGLEASPQDLASLVDPRAALEEMRAKTDEASLIALLQEQPAEAQGPSAAQGRGDMGYVRRLLAIRALQEMGSRKAIPGFEAILEGNDVTLREAAAGALAQVQGRDYFRPSGVEALKGTVGMVPADAGFVLALDLERGAKAVSLRDLLETARAELGATGDLLLGDPERVEQFLINMETAVLMLLSVTGNIRVDSAVVALSDDLMADSGCACIFLKGLCDPKRLADALRPAVGNEREILGHPVFYDRSGLAVCLLDERTAIVALGAGPEAECMERVLTGIAGRQGTPLPASVAPAFEITIQGGARIAFSGGLSDAQKADLRREMEAELRQQNEQGRPLSRLQSAVFRLILDFTNVDVVTAHAETGGKLAARATCSSDEAAATLHGSLGDLEGLVRAEILESAANAPEAVQQLIHDVMTDGGKLWESSAEGNVVIVGARFSLLGTLVIFLLG